LSILIPKTPTTLHIPMELDPPEFQPYRRALMQLCKPTEIEKLQSTVEKYATGFIDEVIEQGQCDLASVIQVPAIVTLDWLGLSPSDYDRYASTFHALIAGHPDSTEYREAATVGLPEIRNQIAAHIAKRRRDPTDDAVSRLLEVELDGRFLTDDQVYSMTELLIGGGLGTTAALIGQVLVWLAQNPDERDRLIRNMTLLDNTALEEFLRFFSPAPATARTVTKDLEFHGCQLREGDRVLLSWEGANRDPLQFEDPDRVDLARQPNRHAAFGIGVHRCAGIHLARLMSRCVISQILERMPDYIIDMAQLEKYPDQGVNTGWKVIPARFTPADLAAHVRPA
jgi:cytochrome P450